MKVLSWSKPHTFQSALRMLSADHLNIDGPPFPVKRVRKFGSVLGGKVTYRSISLLAKYDSESTQRHSFLQQDVFACMQGSILSIHKWHEWFVVRIQTSDTLLLPSQLHHLFLGIVLVFKKRMFIYR